MMRLESMLAASGDGNAPGWEGSDRSTTVMEHREKASRRARAKAVLRPKTPEPMMRIEEGAEKCCEEGVGEGDEAAAAAAI
jgi:hypothetical protein